MGIFSNVCYYLENICSVINRVYYEEKTNIPFVGLCIVVN